MHGNRVEAHFGVGFGGKARMNKEEEVFQNVLF